MEDRKTDRDQQRRKTGRDQQGRKTGRDQHRRKDRWRPADEERTARIYLGGETLMASATREET